MRDVVQTVHLDGDRPAAIAPLSYCDDRVKRWIITKVEGDFSFAVAKGQRVNVDVVQIVETQVFLQALHIGGQGFAGPDRAVHAQGRPEGDGENADVSAYVYDTGARPRAGAQTPGFGYREAAVDQSGQPQRFPVLKRDPCAARKLCDKGCRRRRYKWHQKQARKEPLTALKRRQPEILTQRPEQAPHQRECRGPPISHLLQRTWTLAGPRGSQRAAALPIRESAWQPLLAPAARTLQSAGSG